KKIRQTQSGVPKYFLKERTGPQFKTVSLSSINACKKKKERKMRKKTNETDEIDLKCDYKCNKQQSY
ncbi:MAG: hypothetical protein AAGK05_18190, partial [Pseudomonadota bacterium]